MGIPKTVGGQFLLPEGGRCDMSITEVLSLGILICNIIQIMLNCSNKKK